MALYPGRTGLDFYIGFNGWKSACIAHDVYARYQVGQKSTDGVDVKRLRDRVGECLSLAVAVLGTFTAGQPHSPVNGPLS